METVLDFEDMLMLLHEHRVSYLIIGGMAFIYHAKPRYTKDMDLWLAPEVDNIERANAALAAFGSPFLLDPVNSDEILQLGVAPNRIDLLRNPGNIEFSEAWKRRVTSNYGRAPAYWIDLDSLIEIKSRIDHPRHQEDTRVLRQVQDRNSRRDGSVEDD